MVTIHNRYNLPFHILGIIEDGSLEEKLKYHGFASKRLSMVF